MGETTLKSLLTERKSNFKYLKEQLTSVATKHGEKVLNVNNNRISMACTLKSLNERVFQPNNISVTFFGSYLFSRRVSGVRVCTDSNGQLTKFGASYEFLNYGTHAQNYPHLPYFTSASAIGQTKLEIDIYISRLDEAFAKFESQAPAEIFKQNAALLQIEEE